MAVLAEDEAWLCAPVPEFLLGSILIVGCAAPLRLLFRGWIAIQMGWISFKIYEFPSTSIL